MIRMKRGAQNRHAFIKIELLDKSVKSAIHSVLCEIGQSHTVHCRHLIFRRKTGRIYIIKGAFHQASAPGEPPANLSGELARHVGYIVSGHTQLEFGDKSQQGKAPYGMFLEHGTKKIKPRPHISRTVKDEYKNTYTSLEDSMNRALE